MAHRGTMDFFESQAAAKRKTTLLLFYFLAAVIFIILGVYLAVFLAARVAEYRIPLWHPSLLLAVSAGVILIVLIGTLYKIIALSKGGMAVAEMLGGTPVLPNTKDPDERKLWNVVEEMAIASGVPVPSVCLLKDEEGINAFAAGRTPSDAVIAVTRGAMTHLTRDELQGVVAHEFSHILNGDMGINLRLMGVVNGILIIAVLGRIILRGRFYSGGRRTVSSRKKGNGAGAVLVLGLALMVVGTIGVIFGRLIKSAVSREREFLADSSAVQFTRNPAGLLGALKKIAGLKEGSLIRNPHAEEASHFFFENALKGSFLGWFSTHPPIEERIRRIDPMEKRLPGKGRGGFVPLAPETSGGVASFSGRTGGTLSSERFIASVGSPRPEHVAYAQNLLSHVPEALSEAVREPSGAKSLVYALLFSDVREVRSRQVSLLETLEDSAGLKQVQMLVPVVDGIHRAFRLPLLDVAMPALKELSKGQYRSFREILKRLAEADQRITLFEYALQRVVISHLDPWFEERKPRRVKHHRLEDVHMEIRETLSLLAWEGHKDPSAAEKAFKRGLEALATEGMLQSSILPREQCDLKSLDTALQRLSESSFHVKKRFLEACQICVSSDEKITLREAELLRAVADSLDCPIPPLFPELSSLSEKSPSPKRMGKGFSVDSGK
jgi:Zn-dependent protease with chaperone function